MKCPNPKCRETNHEPGAVFCHRCATRLVDDDYPPNNGKETPKPPLQQNTITNSSRREENVNFIHNEGNIPAQDDGVSFVKNATCEHIAEDAMFAQFPAVRDELLAANYDGEYFSYEEIFSRILEFSKRLSTLLGDEEMVLSNDYPSFAEKVDDYLYRRASVRSSGLKEYENEGKNLFYEGVALRNSVIYDRENMVRQYIGKRNKRNAITIGFVVVFLSALLVWLLFLSSYSEKLETWEKIGSFICLMVVDGCIFAFLRELYNDDK